MDQQPIPEIDVNRPTAALKASIGITLTVRDDNTVGVIFSRLNLGTRRMVFEHVADYETQYRGGNHAELICEAAARYYDHFMESVPW